MDNGTASHALIGSRWPVPRACAPVRATCAVPGSKSLTNRFFVLAALAHNPSTITAPLVSRDTVLMMDALTALGARFTRVGDQVTVTPVDSQAEVAPTAQRTSPASIDCGLAGTVMRFVPPVAVATGQTAHFDGDPQARVRPMDTILDALATLGATVESAHGFLPFTVSGHPGTLGSRVDVDASKSSQFVSGLLLSAARFPHGLTVTHTGPAVPSVPHIAMTVETLRQYGVVVTQPAPTTWRVEPGPVTAPNITVEPDLSNAATFLAAAIITAGQVTVPHWPHHTTQAGHAFIELAHKFGATTELTDAGLTVTGPETIAPIDYDLSAVGELTPVVAAVAAHAAGTSYLRGIGHLRGHETDRLAALTRELTKAGAHVEESPDSLTITSPVSTGCEWDTYEDHRMVMAGALVGLTHDVVITNPNTVSKTLPEFTELFTAMVTEREGSE